jgi:DNA-binding transcriptional MerR regulator
MRTYTIGQLAKLASVSIRTLRYYDKIELLKPVIRANSNYRYYGKDELYRLQQILFYKELDFGLSDIKKLLDEPDFDQLKALQFQRKEILNRGKRLAKLVETIEKTINQIEENEDMLTDKELYEGFSKEEISKIKNEVKYKYDVDVINESNQNIGKMTKSDFNSIKEEQIQQAKDLSELMEKPIDSEAVQAVIKRHHQTNEKFYKTSAEMYKGLAKTYVTDKRFTEFYDKHKPGLAKFLRDAMNYYADNSL